jgi:hypothetical protein
MGALGMGAKHKTAGEPVVSGLIAGAAAISVRSTVKSRLSCWCALKSAGGDNRCSGPLEYSHGKAAVSEQQQQRVLAVIFNVW